LLARKLLAKIRRLPRAVRRRAVQTLEANQAILDQIAADGMFGWKEEQVGNEQVIRKRQQAAGKKALKKVLQEWGDEPEAHPIEREKRLGIPENSKRRAEVVRMSQPTAKDLKKLVKKAKVKGIGPDQIAVVNLRLENNGESKWPKEHEKLKGLKMKHLGFLDHSVPPLDLVKQVLRTMTDPKIKLVVLHCYAGRARTGTMAAAMRMVLDGWGVERTLAEAKELGMERPIQQYFIKWFGRLVKNRKFKL
jgi:protein-tyrosine phosphatase